jgi:hypothetical protein
VSAEIFLNDWARILESELQKRGVQIAPGKDHQKISFAYWNAVHRYIEPKPRTVLTSDVFSCRDVDRPGFLALREAFERGDDVNPYLSDACRNADDPNYNDRLLNDWGIHHFHLGQLQVGKVGRTEFVLLARVTDDGIYLLTTLCHDAKALKPGEAPVWARQLLLGALHRNWPDVLTGWRADSDETRFPGSSFTDNEINAFRGAPKRESWKKGKPKTKDGKGSVLIMPKLPDGAVYHPLGEGSTASGLSVRVLDTSNWYCNNIASIGERLEEQTEHALKIVRENGGVPGNLSKFGFSLNKELDACVFETSASHIGIVVGRLEPPRDCYRFAWF